MEINLNNDEYIQIMCLREAIFNSLSRNITHKESINHLDKNITFNNVLNILILIKEDFLHMNFLKEIKNVNN